MLIVFAFLSLLCPQLTQAKNFTESEAIQRYLDNNLQIIASRFQIDLAKAEELTAGLWANPSLFIDSQLNPVGKNWNQKNAGGPTQQDYILNVPVDANGKRRQAVRVAKFATQVTEAEFQAFIREGLFNVLGTFYSLQKLDRERELLLEKGQLLESLVMTLEKRIGSSNSQPLIQSRARLAFEDVKLDIERNKIDHNTTENQLKILLHLEDPETIEPQGVFKNSLTEKFDSAALIENAKKNRPDFQALELLKKQLEGQAELDQRRIWSDIGLQAGMSRQLAVGARPGDPTTHQLPGAWSWLIGVSLPLPVFDRNQGKILQTKLQSNQTLVREKFMQESLVREIDTSLKILEITNINLGRYKNVQLNNAKLVRDSALRQFGTGATTLLEYLDAVNAYHLSIQKYLSLQYDLTTEFIKLKLISGQEVAP